MKKVKRTENTKELKHQRVIQSPTGALEKRLLIFLAARTPRKVNPDMLTFVGFVAAIIISVSYVLSKKNPIFLWLAIIGFIFNWYGDSMDGTLARYRKIERPRYGYFLDHSLDALSITLIFTGIGFSGYTSLGLAWAATIIYLLFDLHTALVNFTSREFKITFAYIGPTELRIIAIIASIWTYFNNSKFIHLPFGNYSVLDSLLLLLIVVFVPVYLVSVSSHTIRLYKEEPPLEY
ncbi:MAG: CDP-alcohol phosphatidyltransferase family protein [Anaerolineales bacterium]